jgi:biopolymer transport protein ExbD
MMPGRKRAREEAFQMAPMIDMVFLLLVFFMTVSTLARDARPEMALPSSSEAVVPTEAPPRDILSLLTGNGKHRLVLNNHGLGLDELPGRLKGTASAGSPSPRVLRAGPDTPWERLAPVLERLREAPPAELTLAAFED